MLSATQRAPVWGTDEDHTAQRHRGERIGWLRAAVLGANDGLISTSSLVMGIAAAEPSREAMLLAAVAGLMAGAFSMAAGEHISVSSQSSALKGIASG